MLTLYLKVEYSSMIVPGMVVGPIRPQSGSDVFLHSKPTNLREHSIQIGFYPEDKHINLATNKSLTAKSYTLPIHHVIPPKLLGPKHYQPHRSSIHPCSVCCTVLVSYYVMLLLFPESGSFILSCIKTLYRC